MNILDLKKDERALILDLGDDEFSSRLYDMGCYPGNQIHLRFMSIGKDPVCIEINGSLLALRKKEALAIKVKPF